MKKKMPKSIRKYIRKEKARIRRGVLDLKEQERLIKELYQKISKIKPIPEMEKEYEKQKIQSIS